MSLKDQIKAILQEAELYKKQGLLAEAKDKYKAASDIIYHNEQIKNRDSLIAAITSKINALDSDSDLLEHEPDSPELSEKAQDLIKKLFSFSEKKDKDEAVLEGAIALAKFGQYEKAVVSRRQEGLVGKEAFLIQIGRVGIYLHQLYPRRIFCKPFYGNLGLLLNHLKSPAHWRADNNDLRRWRRLYL